MGRRVAILVLAPTETQQVTAGELMSVLLKRLASRVSAADATGSGELVGRACVLRGLHYNDASGGTAGSVVLRDGGVGGDIKLTVHTPGNGAGDDVAIPAGGVEFETDMYVVLTSVDGVTVFYE